MNTSPKIPPLKNNPDELLIYGRRAVEAVWKRRPQAIIRAYATSERLSWLGEMLRWCATQRKAYHMVSPADLEKITHSVHHEGVALLIKAKPKVSELDLLSSLEKKPGALVLLDGVNNPHNIGAIMRTMAHFGNPALIGALGELPEISPAWARISEGATEMVALHRARSHLGIMAALKQQGYVSFALSSQASETIYDCSLPAKSLFLFGNEISGLSAPVLKQADRSLVIPGSGQLPSLNVSAAAALCLGEWYRQQAHTLAAASLRRK